MTTMVLGGLWHGAGWTFVVWGALHGTYLCINHGWRSLRVRLSARAASLPERVAAHLLTFVAVVVAWVFFRASDFDTAWRILDAMSGRADLVIPSNWPGAWQTVSLLNKLGVSAIQAMPVSGFDPTGTAPLWIATLLAVVWFAPNSQQIMGRFQPALESARPAALAWRPGPASALVAGCALGFALLHLTRVSEFLYFQF